MSGPRACTKCLRRSLLLDRLGPYIEDYSADLSTAQLVHLLSLSNKKLATTTAPGAVASELLDQLARMPDTRLRAKVTSASWWGSCKHDHSFPVALQEVTLPPHILIGRGNPAYLARLRPSQTVAVTGATRAGARSRNAAFSLGQQFATTGICVASGWNFGIDACVHRGALEGGFPVAVLNAGVN